MKKYRTNTKEIVDIVIIWVDGSDKEWLKDRKKYNPNKNTDSSEARYRDWGLLKYWFRAVETNMPWCNRIFLVTNGQIPNWLNLNNNKLTLVKHEHYINNKYLPTFNANSIELNLHRIKDLSECFVYFNDDMFPLKKLRKSTFFKNGTPKDSAIITPFFTLNNSVSTHMVINDLEIINNRFDKNEVIAKNISKWFSPRYKLSLFRTITMLPYKKFTGLFCDHMPNAYTKSSYERIWQSNEDILENTTSNKFRSKEDVNQWLIKWWRICEGDFVPRRARIGQNLTITDNNYKEICKKIMKPHTKIVCINDDESIKEYETIKKALIKAFDTRFPKKSSFEK